MVPSARPIKNNHVSAFDGSRSLWSRWITHASDYIFRQKRLQMPSGNPHGTVYTPHQGPEMVSSAPLCGSVSTASPLSSVVSPSCHLAPPSGLLHHHSIVVTAPPCSLFDARAASAKKKGTQCRGGQKSKGTGRLAAITVTKLGIL